MKITTEQLIDIKCALGRVKKNKIADSLNVNSVDLSRPISNQALLNRIDEYFDLIDPEINLICKKLQESDILSVQDERAKYYKNNSGAAPADSKYLVKLVDIQDKHIKHLEDDLWTLKLDIQKIAKIYPDILKPNFGLSDLGKTG